MATGGGNLYPNWLGSASVTLPNNALNTTVTVQGVGTYNTTVNVVPQILLSSISTAVLNTSDPSEILTYVVPVSGWYKTDYQGRANHVSASNWNAMTQLVWRVDSFAQGVLSNTQTLVEPQYISGDSVSEFICVPGGGVFYAAAGDTLSWTTDGNAPSPITSGFSSGFGWITLQKIG